MSNTDTIMHYARSKGALHWNLRYLETCLRSAARHSPAVGESLAYVQRALAEQAERDAAHDAATNIALRTLAAPTNEAVPS